MVDASRQIDGEKCIKQYRKVFKRKSLKHQMSVQQRELHE
jgi:hypothetical protein